MEGQIENIKIDNFWQYSLNTFLFRLISWRRKFFVDVRFPEILGRFLTISSLVGQLRGSFLQKFISSQLNLTQLYTVKILGRSCLNCRFFFSLQVVKLTWREILSCLDKILNLQITCFFHSTEITEEQKTLINNRQNRSKHLFIYLKSNNRNTRMGCELCSKLRKDTRTASKALKEVVLVSLMLTLNIFHKLFKCSYC